MMKRFGLIFLLSLSIGGFSWGKDESVGQWKISGKVEVSHPFIGISHKQIIQKKPRPTVINIIEIDPDAEDVRFLCSPANGEGAGDPNLEVTRLHTFDFVKQENAQVGINTAFYGSISNKHEFADIKGLAASEGDVYSNFYKGWPALNITADNIASIVKSAEPKANNQKTIPADVALYNTIGGSHILLENGVMPETKKWSFTTGSHPRTAVGWMKDGTILLVTVDGRQSDFSEGMTLFELADLFRDLRCVNAINLDGGGSTTMVIADSEPRIANNPSDTFEDGRTGRARFVAASLLVFAKPNPAFKGPLEMAKKPEAEQALPYPQERVGLDRFDNEDVVIDEPMATRKGMLDQKGFKSGTVEFKRQLIKVQAQAEGGIVVREYSGEGEPKNNIALGRVGTIGYWLKTRNKNLIASIVLDDRSNPDKGTSKGHERGSTEPIIADGNWHFYSWDLRVVDHWFGYGDGNGVIDGPNTSLDSILIMKRSTAGKVDDEIELLISDVVYDPKGKLRR